MFRQGKQAVKKPAQQNVVIIYADDLGFGDLGCYGSRKIGHQCDDQRNVDCPREYTEQILVAKDVGCIVGAQNPVAFPTFLASYLPSLIA